MIFDLDSEQIMNSINQAMQQAETELTDNQVEKIVSQIDDALPGIVELLLEDTKEEWKQEAIDSGTGWGSKYARAIKTKTGSGEGSVFVDESVKDSSGKPAVMFAKMIEQGVTSWSIKDALLKSSKAKTSAAGIKYIIIPFPVATPRKKGQGKMKSSFGGREMTSDIHKIVKGGGKAPAGTLSTSGQDISGLSRWTTDQRHEQYGIFRVVTEKSKGWQYPNVGATPVFPSVVEYVNRRIQEVLNAFCQEIIKQNS